MIAVDVEEDIALLTLNRPARRNALDGVHWLQLEERLRDLRSANLAGLIITGEGEHAFAAGADITELLDRTPLDALAGTAQGVLDQIEALPCPSVAAVNGLALGGGCELAMACDFRIAVPEAKIGLPEVRLGILPGAGGTARLPRIVGYPKALELILTGDPVTAHEALRIGLINDICEPPGLIAAARHLLGRIARRGRTATATARRVLQAGAGITAAETGQLLERLATVTVYSDDEREHRMREFLNNRQTGAEE